MVGTSAPPVFKAVPPMISGATKLKLVPDGEQSGADRAPCFDLNNRGDAGGEQRHADDMLGILRRETESRQINSAGVITATNIASRCWKAANRVCGSGGRSSRR